MRRLFRSSRKEEETWNGWCTRTAKAARSIWKKMQLLDMRHKAECGTAVVEMGLCTEEYGMVENTKARNMMTDPNKHSRWKHKWRW